MRRAGKLLLWGLALLIAIPILLVGTVLLGANTDPGRRLIERVTDSVTSGMVRIEGLAGRFPDAIRVHAVRVSDDKGVWLTLSDAAFDWWPTRLIQGDIAVDRLEAATLAVDRLPESSSEGGGGSMAIPAVHGALSRLRVDRLEIGEAVGGRKMVFAIEGSGAFDTPDTGQAHLVATAVGSGQVSGDHPLDRYAIDVSMDRTRVHATLPCLPPRCPA